MSNTILKIGHRGAKAHVSENTLDSIAKALEIGVDAIEIDVHKCASGELVVFHDFTLERMTNGSGEVSKCSLDYLKTLLIDNAYRIPRLTEVLDLINKQCIINIELKGRNTAKATCEVISDYIEKYQWHSNHFLISSFQTEELEKARQINPQLKIGVLTKASVLEALKFAKTLRAYAIHPNVALLTKDNVKTAQDEGYKVIAWTVNDLQTISRLKSYDVDGIISDNPELL